MMNRFATLVVAVTLAAVCTLQAQDANALSKNMMVSAGRGGQRLKQAVLQGTVLEHSQEMYGYMAVYLRLKGIVPPSSERNER